MDKQALLKREIVKCGLDPIYFMTHYTWVQHPVRGLVPFKMFDYQKETVNNMQKNRKNIIVKSRQIGISETVAQYILWLTLFHKDKVVAIVSKSQDNSNEMIRRIKMSYDKIPKQLKIATFDKDSVTEIRFSNRSLIKGYGLTERVASGKSISFLFIDEAALIDIGHEMWQSVSPTISCIVGDTKILTDNGYVSIEEIATNCKEQHFMEVENLNTWGKYGMEKVSHVYVSPESDTLKITTKKGLQLEVTNEHPLYILKKDSEFPEMIKACDINKEDFARIDFGMNIFGNNDNINFVGVPKITNNLAYMLGGYTAEGWFSGRKKSNNIEICNTDPEFRNVYLNNDIIKKFSECTWNKTRLRCGSVELVKLFEYLGVNKFHKCYEKEIPKKIFECSKEIICNYLAGLYDGDGSITDRAITLSSTSIKLLRQVQLLLLNLGIISYINTRTAEQCKKLSLKRKSLLPQGKEQQTFRDNYVLYVSNSQAKLFEENIKLKIQRKKIKLNNLGMKINQFNFLQHKIPNYPINKILNLLTNELNLSYKWFRKNGIRTDRICKLKNNSFCNIELINKIIDVLNYNNLTPSKEIFEKLNEFSGKWFWDEIVSVEKSRNKTYDLTTTTHTFLQNGILGSNTGGRVIIVSTPRGCSGWFYDMYQGAEDGTNGFISMRLPWTVHPEHDQAWFEDETKDKSTAQIKEEYLADFMGSGETFIDEITLDSLKFSRKAPISKDHNDKLWIWKEPEEKHLYAISCDPSRGDAEDNAGIIVIDYTADEQVAEFYGVVDKELQAKITLDLAKKYNNADIIFDNSGGYGGVLDVMLDNDGYENRFFWVKGTVDIIPYNERYFHKENKLVPGYNINAKTRPIILANMDVTLRQQTVKIYSDRIYKELLTFTWSKGKAQADYGKHDDLVMSLALNLWCRFSTVKKSIEQSEFIKNAPAHVQKGSELSIFKPVTSPEVDMQNIGKKTGFLTAAEKARIRQYADLIR